MRKEFIMKYFKFTGETKTEDGIILRRIVATKDLFYDVKIGDEIEVGVGEVSGCKSFS